NTRSGDYFAQNRPDMVATFLSALALICLFSAVRQNAASRAWCGATILVAAFFFKQTSSMYAFVPSLALWFSGERRLRRYLTVILVGQFTFPELVPNLGVLKQRDHRQEEYPQVVAYVRDLPGRVVCPEDPTISVLAKGYASRNVFMEFDVALVGGEWPATVPPYVAAEIQSADYVVDVENSRQDLIRPEQLDAWGFTPSVKGPSWTVYRVWERASPSGRTRRAGSQGDPGPRFDTAPAPG